MKGKPMTTENAVMALVEVMMLAKTMQEKMVITFYDKEAEHGLLPS